MSSPLIRHPAQRSSRLSERDSLFELVPQAPWHGLREPLPVPEVVEDNSEAVWLAFSGPDEPVWRSWG